MLRSSMVSWVARERPTARVSRCKSAGARELDAKRIKSNRARLRRDADVGGET